MQQNQQIINKLLEQQKTYEFDGQITRSPEDNQMTITRVVTAKYKVYVIILLILGVILGMKYLPEGYQHFQSIQAKRESKQAELHTLEQKIQQLTNDKQEFQMITQNKKKIEDCINKQKECSSLPAKIQDNLQVATSYLQLGRLGSKKMKIDEQKILKNLDQYLIKDNPDEKVSSPNGEIEGIEIGEPELADKDSGLYKVDITVKITFSDKDNLVSFVDNIEKFIIPYEEDRILYKINEVVYDMMAYDISQTAEIALSAYYFN